MKGYKAFEKGMICRGKQYAENTVFEEDEAEICKSGMHFCKQPLDVMAYYPLVNENGKISEFAKVEALGEVKTDDGKKYCTRKLKIGKKIDFAQLVQDSIDVDFECENKTNEEVEVSSGDNATIGSSGYNAQIGSSGNWVKIGSSGDDATIGSSGDDATIGSSGNRAKIGSSGDYATIGSSGDDAQIGSSGDYATIGSSGDDAQIGSSGDDATIGSSGNRAKIGSSGNRAQIGSSGNWVKIGSSGNRAQIGSSGDCAKIGSSGYNAQISSGANGTQVDSSGACAAISLSGCDVKINSIGKNSVICCAGDNGMARGKIGAWITLTEWKFSEEENCNIPVCVKTEKIDGKRIKEDTYYKLVNGEFKEVD